MNGEAKKVSQVEDARDLGKELSLAYDRIHGLTVALENVILAGTNLKEGDCSCGARKADSPDNHEGWCPVLVAVLALERLK